MTNLYDSLFGFGVQPSDVKWARVNYDDGCTLRDCRMAEGEDPAAFLDFCRDIEVDSESMFDGYNTNGYVMLTDGSWLSFGEEGIYRERSPRFDDTKSEIDIRVDEYRKKMFERNRQARLALDKGNIDALADLRDRLAGKR